MGFFYSAHPVSGNSEIAEGIGLQFSGGKFLARRFKGVSRVIAGMYVQNVVKLFVGFTRHYWSHNDLVSYLADESILARTLSKHRSV